jgi:hypothetical protein
LGLFAGLIVHALRVFGIVVTPLESNVVVEHCSQLPAEGSVFVATFARTWVFIKLSHVLANVATVLKVFLQLPAEGSVQQRLFQLVERGELALVEGFEALGFFLKRCYRLNDFTLTSE